MDNVFFVMAIFILATMASFVLLLFKKWGIIEYLQVHGNKFVSKMAHCSFCLSWWMCVILAILSVIFGADALVLLVPFFSSPITRLMI